MLYDIASTTQCNWILTKQWIIIDIFTTMHWLLKYYPPNNLIRSIIRHILKLLKSIILTEVIVIQTVAFTLYFMLWIAITVNSLNLQI